MSKKLIVLIPFVLFACSSTPTVKGYEKDVVLETLNNSSQPEWADESRPFSVQSGKVMSVGVTILRGEDRPEAGFRIAENNARANFSKAIENRMEFVFQNAEENASLDSQSAHYIGSEVSSLTSHSMRISGQWYKRYAQSQDDGSRHIYYKIYSLVTMPEDDLKKAISDAVAGKVAEHKLSETFQGQVNKQWDRFVEGKATEQTIAKTKGE